MSWGIYKPGQGYWVRLITAVAVGVVVLAGVGWLWREMETLGEKVSVSRPVEEVQRALERDGELRGLGPLAEVSFSSRGEGDRQLRQIKLVDRQGQVKLVDSERFEQLINAEMGGRGRIRLVEVDKISLVGREVVFAGIPSWTFKYRLYIQAGVAAGIIVVAGWVTFRVLNSPRIVEFMIATEAEMRKVNWPSRREVMGSTWVVICGTLMMAVGLLVVDVIFSELFRAIRVLEGPSVIASLLRRVF